MDAQKVSKWLAEGNTGAIEDAWMTAMDSTEPEKLRPALDALVNAERQEMAQTLASMAIEQCQGDDPARALELAKVLLPALPASDDLRKMAADLFQSVHGEHENFEEFLQASGLTANQSLRRAVRTLAVSLEAQPDQFMVNRFDYRVIRLTGYNSVMCFFEATAADGTTEEYEPKLLADEFEATTEDDFRVLCQFRTDHLGQLLKKDLAKLLTGVCMAHGGKVDATSLKEALVPKYLAPGKWSGWWSRARTAVKKSEVLDIVGRSPAVVEYHPEGKPLADSFTAAAAKARTPLAMFHVLQGYAQELKARGCEADMDFLMPILAQLAGQCVSFLRRRPVDALTACLALEVAHRMSLPVPDEKPDVAGILAKIADPADAIVHVEDPALWPAAMDALAQREDAATQFERLMCIMPASQLDEISKRLVKADASETVEQVVQLALAEPDKYLQVLLWLWKGPETNPQSAPPLLDQFSRLLNLMQDLHRGADANSSSREMCQQISSAIAASNFRSFRAVVKQMDHDVAETFKRRMERSEGLSPTCCDAMLAIVRENYYDLFLQAKVAPWLDETVVWTTEAALSRNEADYKALTEVTMPANSKAVGAAAALGDLSENSEWQYAVEEQRRLQAKASKMQNDLAMARVLHDGDAPTNSVGVGSKVILKREGDGKELALSILGPWDTDVDARIISYKTPLALDLCGKVIGDKVSIKIEGAEGDYVIDGLASAVESTGGPAEE